MIIATAAITGNLLSVLAALALMTGAGSLLARFLWPAGPIDEQAPEWPRDKPRRAWGWSYLLGAAFIGLTLQIPLAIEHHINSSGFSAIVLICFVMTVTELVLRWRQWKRGGGSDKELSAKNLAHWVFGWIWDLPLLPRMFTLLCLANFVWFAAIEPPITFDARSIYGLKARILYAGGDLRSEDFRDPDRLNFNADYPLLIPLVEATIDWCQGSQQDHGMQLFFAGLVFACTSIVVAEIARFEPARIAAMWGAGFLLLPITLMPDEGAGLSGSVDFATAAFATAAVVAAGHWIAGRQIKSAVLSGLMLGGAVCTKQEGLIWLIALGSALVGTLWIRKAWKLRRSLGTAVLSAGIAMSCLLLTAINRQGISSSPYVRSFTSALHWEWMVHSLNRIPFVIQYAIQKLATVQLFSFIWPFTVIALLLMRRPRPTTTVIFWRATAILVTAAYLAIFTITPLHLEYQLRTAFYRLAVHVLPVFMLMAAEQLSAAGWSRQLEAIFRGEDKDADMRFPMSGLHKPHALMPRDEMTTFPATSQANNDLLRRTA